MALIDNLISYYKLDESSGDALDAHASNDGTVTGATQNVSGQINTAYDFDGINDVITFSSVYGIGTTSFSISLWVNITNTAQNGGFIKIGDNNNVGTNNDGIAIGVGTTFMDGTDYGNNLIILFEGVRWIPTSTAIGTGWHHIAVTVDSSGVPSAYLDGSFIASYSGTSMITPTLNSFIGGFYTRSYEGKIDEVAIFDADIGSTEVSNLYNSGDGWAYPEEVAGGDGFGGASRIGDKELKTDWDARTAADSSKAPGYNMALIPQESLIPDRKRVGLD